MFDPVLRFLMPGACIYTITVSKLLPCFSLRYRWPRAGKSSLEVGGRSADGRLEILHDQYTPREDVRYTVQYMGKLSTEVSHICFILQYQVRLNEDGFGAANSTCFHNKLPVVEGNM